MKDGLSALIGRHHNESLLDPSFLSAHGGLPYPRARTVESFQEQPR